MGGFRPGSTQATRCLSLRHGRQATARIHAPRHQSRCVSQKAISIQRTLRDGPHDPFNAAVALLERPAGAYGQLAGWTAAVKANLCVQGTSTSCASRMLLDFKPTYDATPVNLIRQSGAQLTHQTNCDEFGMGSGNVHSVHGPVRNPASPEGMTGPDWRIDHDRAAGGSSGGSAAAVRAGLARFALASDTGGSIRLPAAYCGVVGLKPSYGLVSRWGLVSYADSLDTVGVLARTVDDTSTVFRVLSAPDARDPTCASEEMRTRAAHSLNDHFDRIRDTRSSNASLSGIRIGIPQEYFPKELHPRVMTPFRKTVRALEETGAEVTRISLPTTQSALSAYYIISSAEASSNLARYDGVEYGFYVPPTEDGHHPYAATRSAGFGEEVRKRLLLGTYALTADAFDNFFLEASRVRRAIQQDFQSILRIPNPLDVEEKRSHCGAANGVDVVLHPSAVNTAPTLADSLRSTESSESLAEYVQDILTVPASLAGLPAMSIPAGVAEDDGWPVGVTAVTQWGCEEILFRVGRALESHPT